MMLMIVWWCFWVSWISKQLCMPLAFKEHNPSVCFDFQLEMCADWVEDGVVGFCGIWDEVVAVEVGDEVV